MALVSLEKGGHGVYLLRMQDAVQKNTFTDPFVQAFIASIDELQGITEAKVVLLVGLPEIFCAGASKESLLQLCEGKLRIKDLVLSERVINIPVPTIAVMEGGALGGGLVLGLCCDMVIMAERSMYGANFTTYGFTPGMGCTRLLEGLVGPYVAKEMMFTGKMYKGRTFKERGILNYVLPRQEVFPKALELAETIAEKPRQTLEILKDTLNLDKRKALEEARLQEDLMHALCFTNPELKDQIARLYRIPHRREVKMTEEQVFGVLKKHILEQLEEEVEEADITINKSMFDLGANSLDVVEIVTNTMKELKIKIPREDLAEVEDMRGLVSMMVAYASQ